MKAHILFQCDTLTQLSALFGKGDTCNEVSSNTGLGIPTASERKTDIDLDTFRESSYAFSIRISGS
eukprot:4342273-Amphidinium_carterae.1